MSLRIAVVLGIELQRLQLRYTATAEDKVTWEAGQYTTDWNAIPVKSGANRPFLNCFFVTSKFWEKRGQATLPDLFFSNCPCSFQLCPKN